MAEENLDALLKDFRHKQKLYNEFDEKHPWRMEEGKGPTYPSRSESVELGKLLEEMLNAWKKYEEAKEKQKRRETD